MALYNANAYDPDGLGAAPPVPGDIRFWFQQMYMSHTQIEFWDANVFIIRNLDNTFTQFWSNGTLNYTGPTGVNPNGVLTGSILYILHTPTTSTFLPPVIERVDQINVNAASLWPAVPGGGSDQGRFNLIFGGNDTINGSDLTNDTITGGPGNDTITGRNGTDMIDYSWSTVAMDVFLDSGVAYQANTPGVNQDTLTSFEAVRGSAFGDYIVGRRTGIDSIEGGDGDDFIMGGLINDGFVYPGDDLWGQGGSDTIVGTPGNDTVRGGSDGAQDWFVINPGTLTQPGHGTDSFNSSNGGLDFSGFGPSSGVNLVMSFNGGFETFTWSQGSIFLNGLRHVIGTQQNDEINGSAHDNILEGRSGDDILRGFSGDDDLRGNENNDWMQGGAGNDTIDGGIGRNGLSLSDAGGAIDLTINAFDTGTVTVTGLDTDTFFNIQMIDGGSFDDIIRGNTSDNEIWGNDGNDTLRAGGGNDTLHGGNGLGDVVSYFDSPLGYVGFVLPEAGGSASFPIAGYGFTIFDGMEGVEGSNAGGDGITGNSIANKIDGAGGNDTLSGAAGNDTLIGGGGSDRLSGNTGNNTIDGGVGGGDTAVFSDYVFGPISVGITVVLDASGNGSAVKAGDGTDTLLGIENIEGTNTIDSLTGNDAKNLFLGNNGDDTLSGAGASDTLVGGNGGDWLRGGADNDTIYGGDAVDDNSVRDGMSFIGATAGVTFTLTDKGADIVDLTASGLGVDEYYGIEDLEGSVLGDSLTGNASDNIIAGDAFDAGAGDTLIGMGGNDSLIGMHGGDFLRGGAGNDTIRGGYNAGDFSGLDVISFLDADKGIDFTLAATGSATVSVANLGTDTYFDIEGVEGSTLNDTLVGNDFINAIYGRSGADDLRGHGGNDQLYGDDGNDYLQPGMGNSEFVFGGKDNDMLSFYDFTAGVNLTLDPTGTGTYSFGAAGGIYDSIEDLAGSDAGAFTANQTVGADSLTGNAGGNRIVGFWGNDSLVGLEGSDTLDGGFGDDILLGGLDNDSLIGFDGTDQLTGDKGLDTLDGGTGIDILSGGSDNDTYYVDTFQDVIVEASNGGTADLVISADSYIFHANVENANLTGTAGNGVVGNDLANIINGNSGGNGITGGLGNDTINGADGNDTINGNAGADSMSGGTGNDVYFVDSTLDTVTEVNEAGVFDTIWTTVTMTLPTGAEIIILDGGVLAINATGNAGFTGNAPNLMLGNNAANTITSFGGDDIILGRDGNDTLNTGGGSAAGVEIISGGVGNDTLTSGGGHDFFTYENINEGGDTITDFTQVGGNDLDIFDLRPMFFPTFTNLGGVTTVAQAVASGHLTFTQAGANTQVFADANGGGNNNVLLATLNNTTAATVQLLTLI